VIVRDTKRAQEGSHDLIIIGGGVYGAALALQAAAHGRRALLLERFDFGQETSANSLRIVHGGLRYLQDVDLRRFHQSVEQRRWWLLTFPELVRPLPCLMPLYGHGLQQPSILTVALAVNDALSFARNEGVRDDRRIPRGRVLGSGETRALMPGCRPDGLNGGALWTDASMDSPHRLIVEILRWAVAGGATALNYLAVTELAVDGGRVSGVRGVDGLTGESHEFVAPVVVNAAGPWVADLASRFDRRHEKLFRPSMAFNVLLRKALGSEVAVAVSEPGARKPVYFLRPVGGLTLAGTVHAPCDVPSTDGDPGAYGPPTAAQGAAFLQELGRAIPSLDAGPDDVVRVFWGLLPAARPRTTTLEKRPRIVDHGRWGGPRGLFSVSGVKFTTAPAVGIAVLKAARLARPTPDWERMASIRPEIRPMLAPPPDVHGLRSVVRRELGHLKDIVREESVSRVEDLVYRRLDWNLADIDLEAVVGDVGDLLPGLTARPPARHRP